MFEQFSSGKDSYYNFDIVITIIENIVIINNSWIIRLAYTLTTKQRLELSISR